MSISTSRCKQKVYPEDLPTASVVIIYYNERVGPVLRTVHSVVNRSPPQYLHEVILVDDFSTNGKYVLFKTTHFDVCTHFELFIPYQIPVDYVIIISVI